MNSTSKKLLPLLLLVILLIAIIPVSSVFAAGTIPLTITPATTTANVGSEVKFTISMGSAAGTNFIGFEFKLAIPEGMTYKPNSGTIITVPALWTINFDQINQDLVVSGYGTEYNGAGFQIASFVCTANTPGSHTVTLKDVDLWDTNVQRIPSPVTPSVVTANQQLTSLNVALTAPAVGAAPQMSVSGTGYSGSVTWSGNPATFAPSTAYTATITVNTNPYYLFSTTLVPTVNGNLNGTVTTRSATQIVFRVTFPATPAKTDVSATITFNGGSYQYDGSPKALPNATTTDTSGGSFTYSYVGTGGTNYPASATPPTNVGAYTVTAKYESATAIGTKTASLNITAIALTISGVTAASREYNGTSIITLSGGSLAGVLAGDTNDVGFSLGNGTVTSPDIGTGKAVTTNITLTGAKRGNYTLTQPSGLTVDITPADFTYAVAAAQNIMAGSGLTAITVAPAAGTGVGGASVAGAVAWFSDAARTTAAVNTDLSSLAIGATKELYWRFTPTSTNYKVKEGSTVFTIVDGDPQPMTFATPGPITKTYGDAGFTNIASHTGGGATKGTISYASGNTAVATVSANGAVTIVGAGTTSITATAAAVPGIWAATSVSYTLIVNKAASVAGHLEFTLPGTITYDAAAHAVNVTAKGSLIGFGAILAVKYNGSETAPVNAATYAVTVDVSAGDNYNAATITLGSFTIVPKALTNSMLAITGTYVYSGSPQTPAFTVSDGGAAVSTDDYTVSALPSQTNAGSYPLTITGKRNYKGTATQTFVIAKLEPATDNLAIDVPAALDYDGLAHTASVTAGAGKTGLGAVTLLYNGAAAAPVDAGSYTVTANIAEGANYTAIAGLSLGTIVINPKAVAGVAREMFVKAEEKFTYEFDLTAMLPPGVAASQVSSYTCIGIAGDAIFEGAPAINGTVISVPILATALDSKQAEITIGFVSSNYTISSAILNVIVVDKTVVAVTGVTVTSRTYNGSVISYNAAGLTFTDIISGDIIDDLEPVYTWSGGSAPAGAGYFSLTVSAEDATEYVVTPLVIYFNITKAPLTLKADDKSITVNSALPAFTFTITGLFAPDTWQTVSAANPNVASPTANAGTAGSYPIVISGGSLNDAAGANYYLNQYTNGTLTVSGGDTTGPGTGGSRGTTTAKKAVVEEEVPLALPEQTTGSFSDVKESDWFYGDVMFAYAKGLMKGTASDKFSPNMTMTRAMVVTVLYRMQVVVPLIAYGNPFTDVPEGQWFSDAILWAAANEIVTGYGDGKFGPHDNVTREQLVAMLWRYCQWKEIDVSVGEDTNILSYNDAFSVSEYAIPALQWACGAGIITGKPGGLLDPKAGATRAEFAAMLHRFFKGIE